MRAICLRDGWLLCPALLYSTIDWDKGEDVDDLGCLSSIWRIYAGKLVMVKEF